MTTSNNKYIFTFNPADFTAMTATATADGIEIKHTDGFYKNEIAVTSNGITHAIETPNMPFIYMSCLCVCLFFIVISQAIDGLLLYDICKKCRGDKSLSLQKSPTPQKNF